MQLSKQELCEILNNSKFYLSLKPEALKMTNHTLGGFLRGSSQNTEITHDAVGYAIEGLLEKIKDGTYDGQGAENIDHHKNRIRKYIIRSINSYLVDRSRRWGSNINTNAPAARARVEAHEDTDKTAFFDKLHQDIHTRSSLPKFKEGALGELIAKANLSDDEKWIVDIRSSDIKLSKCIGRKESQFENQDLSRSTCQELEDEKPISKQKPIPNCTCHFVVLTFTEIAQTYGGKPDTYQKRFKKAIDKLQAVIE